MTSARLAVVLMLLLCLTAAGCGYRFVDPFPASNYALVMVGNSTPEAGLGTILEQELRKSGGFNGRSPNRLSVTVTRFTERVQSVGASGSPVRQELAMDIAWKVESEQAGQATFGSVSVRRSYPYSSDPSTLEWNRNAAIRLMSETGAGKVLHVLGTSQ